jgi:MFS family permease
LLGIVRAVPTVALSPIEAVIADRVDQRRLIFSTQGGGLLASLALGVLFAVSGEYMLSLLALAITGALDALMSVTRLSVMHLAAPSGMRGRVIGNLATVSRRVTPLAQVQSGLLAGTIGAPLADATSAAAVAITAAVARADTSLWRFTSARSVRSRMATPSLPRSSRDPIRDPSARRDDRPGNEEAHRRVMSSPARPTSGGVDP